MTPQKTPAIEVHDMTVSYHNKTIIRGIDLDFPQGKFIGILGPNGVGKSTLLQAIMSIVPIQSGYVKLFGQPLHKIRQRISYIPQRQTVDWTFPANVQDIVTMGRYMHMGLFKRPNATDKKIVCESLEQVNMLPFAQQQIGMLSVGQQQKVFIARALAQRPDIYLLDEPLVGVDATTSTFIFSLLKKLVKQGKTVIMIHHNLEAIQENFDHLILLNTYVRAAGPIKKVFTPELIRETYNSQLNILTQISHLIRQEEIPIRKD